MKSKMLLTISLALNFALAGLAVYALANRSSAAVRTLAPSNAVIRPATAAQTNRATTPGPAPAPAVVKVRWREIGFRDSRAYIANLRAIGCPEETIRDIIVGEVERLYAPRLAPLRRPSREYRFWEFEPPWVHPEDRERLKKRQALEMEKWALCRDLLGIDLQREAQKYSGHADYLARVFPFLPEAKRDQADKLQQKYQEQEQDQLAKARGRPDAEEQQELKRLYRQHRAELAQVLTPQELEEYEMRVSPAANLLRYELLGFDPTEQESRALFRLRRPFEDYLDNFQLDPDDSDANAKRFQAQQQYQQQLRTALGEKRYAEYYRSQDYGFRSLIERGVAKDIAARVYAIKRTAEDRARQIRANNNLTWPQRQEALNKLQTEAAKDVADLLGERGFKAYKIIGGQWLRALASVTYAPGLPGEGP
jgi:hypothetical protein